MTDEVKRETKRLMELGMKDMDAAHAASAQAGGADFFLTVDDSLLRIARKIGENLSVRVESPLAFLLDAIQGEAP